MTSISLPQNDEHDWLNFPLRPTPVEEREKRGKRRKTKGKKGRIRKWEEEEAERRTWRAKVKVTYDIFPENTIIVYLWYHNHTFPTWQH